LNDNILTETLNILPRAFNNKVYPLGSIEHLTFKVIVMSQLKQKWTKSDPLNNSADFKLLRDKRIIH